MRDEISLIIITTHRSDQAGRAFDFLENNFPTKINFYYFFVMRILLAESDTGGEPALSNSMSG